MSGGCIRVTRSMGAVLVALLVATALAACGDTRDSAGGRTTAAARTTATQPAAPPASEDADADASDVVLARRALVRLSDMPQSWGQDRGTVTRLHCGRLQVFRGATALVRSNRLTLEHAGVQERIAIYPNAAAALRALRRLDSPTAVRCLQRELRRHVSEESGGPAGPADLVREESLGPAASARRYVSVSVSSYGKVVGYIDAVHQRLGRVVAALVLVAGPTPPDEELYDDVVGLVSRRLRVTLG